MTFFCPTPGWNIVGRALVPALAAVLAAFLALGLAMTGTPALANDEFPFDRELLLDTAPMRPGKRVPIISVLPDGRATIDLWCKSVAGRVDLAGSTIRIEAGPMPEALPAYMGEGQCTPARMQADHDTLADIMAMTSWRKAGNGIDLAGPKVMKFRPATN